LVFQAPDEEVNLVPLYFDRRDELERRTTGPRRTIRCRGFYVAPAGFAFHQAFEAKDRLL